MKKATILILLVSLLFILGASGCEVQEEKPTTQKTTTTTTTQPKTSSSSQIQEVIADAILHVSFNDPNPLKDYSRSSQRLTPSGNIEENHNPTAGFDGSGSYKFDGINDYIKILDLSGYNKKAVTIIAWAKRRRGASISQFTQIVGSSNGASSLIVAPPGDVYFQLNLDGTNRKTGGVAFNDDTWTMFAGTWKQGSKLKIYKNGDLASDSITSYDDDTSSITRFWIGRYDFGTYFDGMIDEVIVFNRELSPEEIKILYNR